MMHPPIYVFFIFFGLVYLGVKATRPRLMTLSQLWFLPVLLSTLMIYTTLKMFNITIFDTICFLLIYLLAFMVGYHHARNLLLEKQANRILLPGSYQLLVIFMLIFAERYFVNYSFAGQKAYVHTSLFLYSIMSFSAVVPGFLMGYRLRIYKKIKSLQ